MEKVTLLNGTNINDIFVNGGFKLSHEDKESSDYSYGNVTAVLDRYTLFIQQETLSSYYEWLLVVDEIKNISVNTKQISVTMYNGNIFLFRINDGGE